MTTENIEKDLTNSNTNVTSSGICDSLGNLVLYSSGDSVWDQTGSPIRNNPVKYFSSGRFNILFGSPLILPKGKTSYWLLNIFDSVINYNGIAVKPGPTSGYYYTVIDKDANGTWQLNPIYKEVPFFLRYILMQNVTAVKGQRPYEYWILSRYSDTLYAFEIDSNGIAPPVKTIIKEPLSGSDIFSTRYQLCPSLDSKTVLSFSSCYLDSLFVGPSYSTIPKGSYIYSYSFDNETGKFSNALLIDSFKQNSSKDPDKLYNGAAFSPNDSLYYICLLQSGINTIWQYKRYNPDPIGSRMAILKNRHQIFDIKLGPDGKIYLNDDFIHGDGQYNCYLSVINFPDKIGSACAYVPNAIDKKCVVNRVPHETQLFPNTLNEYIRLKYKTRPICGGLHFEADHDPMLVSFTWHVSSAAGFSAVATGEEADIVLKTPGWYGVRLMGFAKTGYSRCYIDSFIQISPPKALFTVTNDTACVYNRFFFRDVSMVDSSRLYSKAYTWLFGDDSISNNINPSHIYIHQGAYTVRLVLNDGICKDTFTYPRQLVVRPAPIPGFKTTPTNGCAPLAVDFLRGADGTGIKYLYDFGDGQTDTLATTKHTYTDPGAYKAIQYIYAPNRCIVLDSHLITVFKGLDANAITDVATATVDSIKHVQVFWDTLANAVAYIITRFTDNSIAVENIGTFKTNSYTDINTDVANHFYTYKVAATDTCGNNSPNGLTGTSILLKGLNSNNKFAMLEWTPYKTWKKGIKNYQVQRLDANLRFSPVATVSPNITQYKDYSFYTDSVNARGYRIVALPNDTTKRASVSNTISVRMDFILYIPNAFSPNGDSINDKFEIKVIAGCQVSLHIYNRWGELVNSSTNGNDGIKSPLDDIVTWDGTFHGKTVAEGIYLYKIEVKSPFTGNYYSSGTVEVLK